jgi:hypothetical protein
MLELHEITSNDLESRIEYYQYQFKMAVERRDPKAIKFHGNKVAIFIGLDNDRLEDEAAMMVENLDKVIRRNQIS